MSSYTIAAEFLVLRDGVAVHYTRAQIGSTIELTDDEAAPLLAEGKVTAVGAEPHSRPDVFTPTDSVEVQGEVAERPDDAEPGEQIDSEGAPEPAIEAEPQPRRGRRRSWGSDEG
ncbi:head-tail connector protein [Mycobacterium phage GreaseLightnin]|uniref:Uncharacterized protein n=5 Tax=Fishburnevirus TaxID=1983734 RepID=A0A482JDA7_9CAUD|nr:head-tail connector protein [Mycobacterium phage Fishburne]YP_009964498.1 head-tail connector protein [Mycobacterium phage GreaseLightnin]YP_009964658.1 head-tail connector protein [Mycobacterium phage Phineas]YP_009964735.1 head-tail connector protein [Mycobacterium phage Bartholomew]YP_009964812.1 head-tail connector protein [Mycobacterium phage FirstPlacePfu]ASR84862.1 hypothetical protein SEA_STEVIERAY_10 [Mycobacterium phage StevieRay]QBI97946.1 hypothetical protein SEA_ZILIZEBETH_10 